MRYYRGPIKHGYERHLVAKESQIKTVAKLHGDAMWAALEHCDWIDVAELPESAVVYSTSSDGDTLRVDDDGRFHIDGDDRQDFESLAEVQEWLEEDDVCGWCGGSGEGSTDRLTCSHCRGSGIGRNS